MTITTKVRLVLCPKCRQLLPELTDHPIYTCGGCGTVLQAKNRNQVKKSVSSTTRHEKALAQKNELEHNSVDKESINSSEKVIQNSTEDCSSDLTKGREQIDSDNFAKECAGSRTFSSGVSYSGELHCPEKEESSSEAQGRGLEFECPSTDIKLALRRRSSSGVSSDCHEKDESSSEARGSGLEFESPSSDTKLASRRRSSSGVSSSGELDCHEKEKSSSEARGRKLDLGSPSSETKLAFSRRSSSGVPSSGELDCHEEEESSFDARGRVLDFGSPSSDTKLASRRRSSGEISSSGELDCHNKESSSCEARGRELDFGSPSSHSKLASRRKSSTFTPHIPSNGSISPKTDHSSWNEKLEQFQKTLHDNSDHVESRETLEITQPVDHGFISEELSGTIRDFSKSPTTRSSHAYDGSVSSCDGLDDRVSDRFLHLSKKSLVEPQKVPEFVGTKGRSTAEDVLVSNNSTQHQVRKFSSMSLHEKSDLAVTGHADGGKDELPEAARYGFQVQEQVNLQGSDGFDPVRNWNGKERSAFLSREPFYRRASSSLYEKGSSSNYRNENFLHNSRLYSTDTFEYRERMELLRKVDELRDQLNRSYAQGGYGNGRFPNRGIQHKNQWSLYYDHEPPDLEFLQYYDATFPRQIPGLGVHKPRKTWPSKPGFSQMPFSSQATNCSHNLNHSCLHCYHEDGQWQPKLPPASMCCNIGSCRGHSGHRCCNPYSSNSSSRPPMDSNFCRWGLDTWSYDQRLMKHEVQESYYKKTHQPVKQHCLPIAGGAPFIICYSCKKLLQLPADSLLSRKRFHKLKCSACSEVLKFSLHYKTHVIPYTRNQTEPQPIDVDNSSDAINRRNLASSCTHGDPMSFSEDYVFKSSSTEGGTAFPVPRISNYQGIAVDKRHPSIAYPKLVEARKKLAMKQSVSKNKNQVEASEPSDSPSDMANLEKLSLEAAYGSSSTGSPLHHLMGYSSPSEMINGSAAGIYS